MPKLIVQEGYKQVSEYVIPEGITVVGRSTDCDLVLAGRGVSRRHVRFARDGNVLTVEDMGSRNGTFVNSAPLTEPLELKHMDVTQLGESLLVYNEVESDMDEATVSGELDSRVFDLKFLQTMVRAVTGNIARVVQGKDDVIENIVLAMLSDGHVLIEDVPGVGKTMLGSALAKSIRSEFKRIQFTPDLMPSDITGTEVIQEDAATGNRTFTFVPGPIFANIILADEVNRTPPKTQAAMLEAMQEGKVSVGGQDHELGKPFFVMATQNPLEQEGTYPLPEAQQDRFLFKIIVDYPAEEEEKAIVRMVTSRSAEEILPVLSADDILEAQKVIRSVPVADAVIDYATRLVRTTRLNQDDPPEFIQKWTAWGCGPRASIFLVSAAKVAAVFRGAEYVSCQDIAAVCHPVMRHRLAVNYAARAEGVTSDHVIDLLLEMIPPYETD